MSHTNELSAELCIRAAVKMLDSTGKHVEMQSLYRLAVVAWLCAIAVAAAAATTTLGEAEQELLDIYHQAHPDVHINGCWVETDQGRVHYLRNSRCDAPSLDNHNVTLLLVHGAGTTSVLAWRTAFPLLTRKGFDVVAVDLPGFGRTSMSQEASSLEFRGVIQVQCRALQLLTQNVHMHKVFVVGHSLGGYVVGYCASVGLLDTSGLLLADTPGLLAINGRFSHAVATIFRLGLPQSLLRIVGPVGNLLAARFLDMGHLQKDGTQLAQATKRYWLELHRCKELVSDNFLHKFVDHTISSTSAKLPLLPFILNITVPVSFVHGELDNVAPAQQGQLMAYLGHLNSYMIRGIGHAPYHARGVEFAEVIVHAVQHGQVPSLHAKELSKMLVEHAGVSWAQFSSSWSLTQTINNEQAMHDSILAVFHSLTSVIEHCGANGQYSLTSDEEKRPKEQTPYERHSVQTSWFQQTKFNGLWWAAGIASAMKKTATEYELYLHPSPESDDIDESAWQLLATATATADLHKNLPLFWLPWQVKFPHVKHVGHNSSSLSALVFSYQWCAGTTD